MTMEHREMAVFARLHAFSTKHDTQRVAGRGTFTGEL